jgi:hypothetical protein
LDGEGASPTQVNPIRPRYAKAMVTNLPEVAKSEAGGVAMSTSTRRAIRGGWGGRALKDRLGTWETRRGAATRARGEAGALWPGVAACGETGGSGSAQAPRVESSGWRQRQRGMHNPLDGRGRESERPIVAMKWGNARGAKGPHFSYVAIEERKPA